MSILKNKDVGDGINNFRPLRMLSTELKIMAKILAGRLKTVLPSLIDHKQTCCKKYYLRQLSFGMLGLRTSR